jgi:hypothetical protein
MSDALSACGAGSSVESSSDDDSVMLQANRGHPTTMIAVNDVGHHLRQTPKGPMVQ